MCRSSCVWINFPYSDAEHAIIRTIPPLTWSKFIINYCGFAKCDFI